MIWVVVLLGIAVVGLVVAVVWLTFRPMPALQPSPISGLDDLRQLLVNLQAQIGRDSGLQQTIQQSLGHAQTAVEELHRLKIERQSDRQVSDAKLATLEMELRKVSGVLAGRNSGGAGENILREALRLFPSEWVRSPFQVGGNDVEFGLVLFNKQVIPIDSKFAATELLEAMARPGDDGEKVRALKQIEDRVLKRAAEVGKYLDPSTTTPFAICAVPDSVYQVLRSAHLRAWQDYRVMVMSYSTTIPVLLALFHLHQKYAGTVDEAQLEACLSAIETQVVVIHKSLENKVKEAETRLGNAYAECSGALGMIEGSLAKVKASRLDAVPEEVREEVTG